MSEHHHVLYEQLKAKYSSDQINMSMSDWVCRNTTLRGKPFSTEGYEFQRKILDDLHPNLSVIKISQVGLALALDTPIPTPQGWTRMGDLSVGDTVYDEQGNPTTIQYVSPIYEDHVCYAVEFDDGQIITADENHRWFVQSERMWNEKGMCPHRGRIPLEVAQEYRREGVTTTKFLAENTKSGNRNLFAIPNTQPLQSPPSPDVPLDPYYLGLWLGDGHSHSTQITGHRDDITHILRELTSRGFSSRIAVEKGDVLQANIEFQEAEHLCKNGHDKRKVGVTSRGICRECCRLNQNRNYAKNHAKRVTTREQVHLSEEAPRRTVHSVLSELRVLKDKHIPEAYLRAPPQVRFELLQGLMDTDGSVTKRGRCSFYNTNPRLVSGVEELIATLGFKFRTRWREPTPEATLKSGHTIRAKEKIAEVSFVAYAETPVFRLLRKAARLVPSEFGRTSEALRRRVISVEKVATVPVRCISVDSPNHLFLAGRGMVPTHNTEINNRKMLGFLERNQGTTGIFTFPNQAMRDKNASTRFKPIIDGDAIFNKPRDEKATRTKTLTQLGLSFLHITDCTEGAATSTPADILMTDEIDLSDMAMVALFQSRLENSDYKITQNFSTPTHESYGVDAEFTASDQQEYMYRCPCCNHWQIPDFTPIFVNLPGIPDLECFSELEQHHIDHIDFGNVSIHCEKCSAPLNLLDPDLREWVPRYPRRTLARGYRVRPFSTSRRSVESILTALMKYKRNNFIRGWWNTVIGKAYTAGDERLRETDILACLDSPKVPDIDTSRPIAIGIDAGIMCHCVLIDLQTGNPFLFEVVHSERLAAWVSEVCNTYNVIIGGMDRHPQTVLAKQVFDASGGKVWPIEYRGTKTLNPVKDSLGNTTHYQCDRTASLDRVATGIRSRTMRISGYDVQKQTIVNHLTNMVRDESPETPAVWKKLDPADHYFHALGFGFTSKLIADFIDATKETETRTLVAFSAVQSKAPRGLLGR